MRFSLPLVALLCSPISLVVSSVTSEGNQVLQRSVLSLNSDLEARGDRPKCTPECTLKRKEWRSLSKRERKSYIKAVLCLRKKPSLYKEIPGCKSRYDDFQVLHIKQTFIIHFNAQFLAWHRWFTWAYEKALRDECGYRGSQPYWDWTLDAADIEASPVFDGSPYSMSGNGKAIPGRSDLVLKADLPGVPPIKVIIPPGTGGGCVTTGPFANLEVPFGPVALTINASFLNNPKNLDYKPHCLRRDLNPKIASSALTKAGVDTLLQTPNITAFTQVLDQGPAPNTFDVHGGGHFSVGIEMTDTFSSPGDPVFFLHHTQIDRLWTLWQKKDPASRQYALSGTATIFNFPPSAPLELTDKIDLGKLSPGGPRPVKEFMNTKDGPFCYEYV